MFHLAKQASRRLILKPPSNIRLRQLTLSISYVELIRPDCLALLDRLLVGCSAHQEGIVVSERLLHRRMLPRLVFGLLLVVIVLVAGGKWIVGAQPYVGDGAATEADASCDYGRNPENVWADNPSGHPFERPFCDGIGVSEGVKHPLDTPENAGKFCDEVPGCWAYAG